MTTTIELIRVLKLQASDDIASGHVKDAALMKEAAQRLRELDKPDCVWVKLPCGRDSSGNDINSYDPSCIVVYTDEPLPMKLSKFCHLCGGAVKEST